MRRGTTLRCILLFLPAHLCRCNFPRRRLPTVSRRMTIHDHFNHVIESHQMSRAPLSSGLSCHLCSLMHCYIVALAHDTVLDSTCVRIPISKSIDLPFHMRCVPGVMPFLRVHMQLP